MAQNPASPPQALEAEMAVLGSMLIEREACDKALDSLHESDFYLDAHKRVFRAVHFLFNGGQAVDVITVSEQLRKKQELDAVGGGAFLAELINKVTTAAHVEHYARLEGILWERVGEYGDRADNLSLPSLGIAVPLAEIYRRIPQS